MVWSSIPNPRSSILYPLSSILYPPYQWSEPESNGPLSLFRRSLIRLSYPTGGDDGI
jgi:hypothetical protein